MSELLTLKEAARLAFVSYETIIYWIKTGRLAVVKGPPSIRSGRPYNRFVRREDLLLASPRSKELHLKSVNPHLMTVSDICAALWINKSVAYLLVRRFKLDKIYIDGWTYMIDGAQLATAMEEDPTYYHLLKQRRPATLV
jgi:hypothetical protein